jgi:membrane protein DedA with SNARE-associated domain
MSMSEKATVVATAALLLGLTCGYCLGWFRGYTICRRERRSR